MFSTTDARSIASINLSRRGVIFAGAATLAAASAPAMARTRLQGAGAKPGATSGSGASVKDLNPIGYRFNVGDIECISIADGSAKMPPKPLWAPEVSEDEVKKALRDEFLPDDALTVYFNILVIRAGKETILIDTGNGGGQPATGMLVQRLTAAGIQPADVTGIIISHMHGDHFGGLSTNGSPTFSNAAVYTNAAERDFWLKAKVDDFKSAFPTDRKQASIDGARKAIDGVGKALQVAKPGDKLFGCVELVDAPGHTPGHLAIKVGAGKDSLLHFADTAHHQAIMVPHPEWSVMFDTDSSVAKETRKKLFARAASEGTRLYSYHLPWPGIGRLKAEGNGYRWVAEPWMFT